MVSVLAARQLCTFWVGDLHLAIDVPQVQEVIRFHHLTRVPLAPPAVRGLINLRGQIVTAVDLRQRLQLPVAANSRPMNVIVRWGEMAVSLLVDTIGDVVEADADRFEPPPPTLEAARRALIEGAYKLEGSLLLVLDLAEVVAGSNPHLGAAAT